MYKELALIELAIWLGLPAWIANATPVIFGGGRPIDGGHLFRDGRRLLGDGKTVRGFIVGVVFGTITGTLQAAAVPYIVPVLSQYVTITTEMETVLFINVQAAFAMSIGALLGDMVGSFIKRRINLQSGGPAPVLDQLGFIILGLLIAAPFIRPNHIFVMILIGFTLLIHYISNVMGYLLGFKKHPW
ncbi:MAG: CDP-2,3-bis-(O-geranylgeranyl)-sn-glycerol synthase [Candidatus Thorarchaeota archaeon]|nr:CDP-2,3-bis-(O-geranylgeranyl)-sn-glycerol synthase [Candidatus Thorarchaeota archaeon]